MCESNAYVYDEAGKEMLYLESVDLIRPEGGKIFLKNLFGEQKLYDGEIKEIALMDHKIILGKKS